MVDVPLARLLEVAEADRVLGSDLEPRRCKKAIQRQRARDAPLRHHSEADGVGQREILVVKRAEPIGDRSLLEVGLARDDHVRRLAHGAHEIGRYDTLATRDASPEHCLQRVVLGVTAQQNRRSGVVIDETDNPQRGVIARVE